MLINSKVDNGVKALSGVLPQGFKPEVGLVLGTGLGRLADELRDRFSVNYSEIPDYPVSTVSSHAGRFSFGYLGGQPVVLQEGRCHLYEGYSPEEVARGVRIMSGLGAGVLIITNAAGSLNPLFSSGSIMSITDQINFTGQSPLAGLPDLPGLCRFPDMSRPYDPQLVELAGQAAMKMGVRLEKGVYLGLTGPQLETRAETRMFRSWGVDAVGMSTVMEVIAAVHLGMRVMGLSVLSNQNLPDGMAEVTLEEIIATSNAAAQKLGNLLKEIVPHIRN